MTVENTPVAIALPTLQLTKTEKDLVDSLLQKINRHELANRTRYDYYMGEQRIKNLGISIPPHLQGVDVVVGWTRTVVDSLKERLAFQGWRSYNGDDFGLGDIYSDNQLKVDSKMAHADALIFGTSFIVVGAGFDGEPNPLITVESARSMTGFWDSRTRRLSAALAINSKTNETIDDVTLFLPNANLHLVLTQGGWYVAERNDHNLGRVLAVQLINNPMSAKPTGQSEITRALRSYVDDGVQTMLGMKVNREFYASPQRWMMGADESMFVGPDGQPRGQWSAQMSRFLMAPSTVDEETGDVHTPTVGQFSASSPQPFVDQLRALSQMVASEGGIPINYLGFVSDNPASADAIRAGEAMLIKRAEERQDTFERGWLETGRLALLVRDGVLPDNFRDITIKWRDPATPTRSAAADEAIKLASGDNPIIPPDSTVLYDRLGLDPDEQKRLQSDKRAGNAATNLQAIRDAVAGTTDTTDTQGA